MWLGQRLGEPSWWEMGLEGGQTVWGPLAPREDFAVQSEYRRSC